MLSRLQVNLNHVDALKEARANDNRPVDLVPDPAGRQDVPASQADLEDKLDGILTSRDQVWLSWNSGAETFAIAVTLEWYGSARAPGTASGAVTPWSHAALGGSSTGGLRVHKAHSLKT